jgi:photolyase PhrII
MRDHENPALDTALCLAQALDLPVQVVQVLSERYPYASDRHHTFILEGARDVARALKARGIPYAFHLERPGARTPVLRELAARAHVVVTELMPVAPLTQWTQALAKTVTVIEVDASCIFPMTTGLTRAPTRAFEFRKASAKSALDTLARGYPTFPWNAREAWARAAQDLPFAPVDLQAANLADLVANVDIDHGVAPVPDSTGGSTAGYQRWSTYVEKTLHRYAATRNDPLADTTSRMSAYLHYGQVSPFRIAGDLYARRDANPGAEKLLDELLIWRELAYHHAFHAADHAQISSLPAWAQATLKEHETDRRSSLPSWAQLSVADTEDPLWNACQQSLLAHGELHNNVRMTWGKRLLGWTENAEDALALLLDLNHRYALDGRDPASYAGIRWCFGAFDRPFSPETSVLGTVRPRPSEVHAERLSVPAFTAFVRRSPFSRTPRVAIVGSGVAGLAAAQTLQNHNVEVVVFDKGRRPGGRLVSRELLGVPFDYGAQYITAKSASFRQLVNALVWEEQLSVWSPRTVRLVGDTVITAGAESRTSSPWYIAPRGFSGLAARLAEGLDVRQSRHIASCTRADARGRWQLAFADGAMEEADALLLTVPGPQLSPILGRQVDVPYAYAPCWSLSLGFDVPLPVPFDAAHVDGSDLLWICRENNKPGRDSTVADVWTLHASTAFSQSMLDADPDTAKERMIRAFFELPSFRAHHRVTIVGSHLHKWRYARAVAEPVQPSTEARYQDGLGLAGDSLGGPRVESAYLSGVALAGSMLRTLAAEGAGPRR